MSESSEQRAGEDLFASLRGRAPGRIVVMPMRFAELGTPKQWSREHAIETFRGDQRAAATEEAAAIAEAERIRSARLDWIAHVPTDEAAPASGSEGAPALGTGAAGMPARDMDAFRAEWLTARWRGAEASARLRAEAGELADLPTAAEYATWTDEQLAALRIGPEGDGEDEDGEDGDWDDESAPSVDVHPVNLAVEAVERAQQVMREAEAARVLAAMSAWRVTEATVVGTEDASVNGPYFTAVVMDIANRLQIAERTATSLIRSAMDLESMTPRCWQRFVLGEVPWRVMQLIHARLEGLDVKFLAAFDEQAAAVITTVAVPKLKKRLRTIRERVQAETASERHKRALTTMQVTIEPLDDGMVEIVARVPAAEGVSIDQRLDLAAREAAKVDGETRSIAELRAHVLLDVIDEGLFRGARPGADGLAVPTRRGVQVKVGVMIPAKSLIGRSDAPAVLEGYGPIDMETAKRLLGDARSFFRVFTDPITGVVKDIGRKRYRPTAEMRTFLGIVDGGGRGPNSDRPPSRTEIDHVIPFRQGLSRGRTALDNLVLLATRDHRIKTSGLWEIVLLANRHLVWTSFFGTRLITTVDPTVNENDELLEQICPF